MAKKKTEKIPEIREQLERIAETADLIFKNCYPLDDERRPVGLKPEDDYMKLNSAQLMRFQYKLNDGTKYVVEIQRRR